MLSPLTLPLMDPAKDHPDGRREDRRRFLKMLSAGSAAALLPGCQDKPSPASPDEAPTLFFKDTAPFVRHGNTNLETRLEDLDGFLTPVDHFFVRNNASSIALDAAGYRLQVEGEAVETPLSLTYKALVEMSSRTVFSYVECGGNQRGFFGTLMGQPAQGTQWGRGGVGMAEWTGVPLAEVLTRAGVRESAVAVQLIGLDTEAPEGGFRRPIPIAKAMDPDTILAYRMNGALLPRDHGFPIRAIVPGWVGSNSIKWLGRIEVAARQVWSRNNTTSYVLLGDAYAPEGEAGGQIATLQSIKSALTLPWPAALPQGRRMIRGYAHSPHAPVERVAWSADGGETWQEARVLDPLIRYAWARFEFEWTATPGQHTLTTRATDQAGNTQPDEIPFNEKGYLFNRPLPHPVTVT